jgi:integrase
VRDLIEAVLVTGARPGELVAAPRSAFDARTKTLTLRGKTGARTVPLSPAAAALFERLSKSKLPAAPLLTRDDGKPWQRAEWTEDVRVAADAAAVKCVNGNDAKLPAGVCLYSCRHSYITQAVVDGLTTLDVAKLMGTSLAMIDKHYGHLVQTSAERLAKVQML